MELNKLDWDSSFFGIPVFRVSLDNGAQIEKIHQLISNRPSLVYIFLGEDEEPLRPQLASAGALFLGTRVRFVKEIVGHGETLGQGVEDYKGKADDQLRTLALKAGACSRFRKDPRLVSQYEAFYKLWLENSLLGSMADKTFVHRSAECIDGFATCSINDTCGKLGLIAVDDSARQRGIGGALMSAVENYYSSKGLSQSVVDTQAENESACRFYESLGYVVASRQFTYHWWLN